MSFVKREDITQKSGSCLLSAGADMTIYSSEKNLTDIKGYYSEFNHLELDLSAVEEIDTSGVQLLLALKKSSEKDGKSFFLSGISAPVDEVMEVLNIRSNFNWVKSE